MKGISLTHTRLRVAVRVMGYYIIRCPLQGLCRLGAVQTTSLLVVMIVVAPGLAGGTEKA